MPETSPAVFENAGQPPAGQANLKIETAFLQGSDQAATGFHCTDPTSLPIPRYLNQIYWWAYVHPRAVSLFERKWLIDAILFGNYARLCDAAVDEFGAQPERKTLQIACVYGDLTERLREHLAGKGHLDVLDILPVQLSSLARKLKPDNRVSFIHGDSSSLPFPDASYDQALMFFLIHEQPPEVRSATLMEAMRVVRPGGKIVIVDYHRPKWWHPLRPLMWVVFRVLEPYAPGLWKDNVEMLLPEQFTPAKVRKSTYFGGLYQKIVITR